MTNFQNLYKIIFNDNGGDVNLNVNVFTDELIEGTQFRYTIFNYKKDDIVDEYKILFNSVEDIDWESIGQFYLALIPLPEPNLTQDEMNELVYLRTTFISEAIKLRHEDLIYRSKELASMVYEILAKCSYYDDPVDGLSAFKIASGIFAREVNRIYAE